MVYLVTIFSTERCPDCMHSCCCTRFLCCFFGADCREPVLQEFQKMEHVCASSRFSHSSMLGSVWKKCLFYRCEVVWRSVLKMTRSDLISFGILGVKDEQCMCRVDLLCYKYNRTGSDRWFKQRTHTFLKKISLWYTSFALEVALLCCKRQQSFDVEF